MGKLLRNIVQKKAPDGAKVIDEVGSLDMTPYIKSYQVEYMDLDASNERTASGKSVRDYIRTVKTVKCILKPLLKDEALQLLEVLNKKEVTLAYFDTFTGKYSEEADKLLHAYPSVTRNVSVYGTNPRTVYNEITVDFIEF